MTSDFACSLNQVHSLIQSCMDLALQLGFLNKPFNLDPGQDFHSALVVNGWMSGSELAYVWGFYQAQLHSFLFHYERILLVCTDSMKTG